MIVLKASTMEHIASLDTGSGSVRRKLGHRLDRPVPASMQAALIQQALFTRLCSMGIPVHEAIPIGHDLDEIAREGPEPNLIWIGYRQAFRLLCEKHSAICPAVIVEAFRRKPDCKVSVSQMTPHSR